MMDRTRRGAIVTLSGVDCAGKSTQLVHITRLLSQHGIAPKTMWYRPGYGPELDALRRTVREFRPGVLPAPGQTADRTRLFRRPMVARTWFAIALVDTLLQFAAKARVRRLCGEVVVCDRYIEDALIDLSLGFPEIAANRARVLAVLRSMCPRPDLQILLMLEEPEVIERAARKREPFPDSEQVRRKRYQAYAKLARRGRMLVVDGGAPISDVTGAIRSGLFAVGILDART